jgi:hypothetical protein
MNNREIKRQLGIGMGTLAGKWREYKDPFEPRDPPAAKEPADDLMEFLAALDERSARLDEK